ncbi:MAG: Trk system potassium transporter TrkA [Sedimentisphaerales bacterium]|nr:Trk system potassium transporter TrkA [Sedimentisphaerales bacterium]
MRVILAGAGEIGWFVAEQVSAAGHDVTLIEHNEGRVREASNELDVRALPGLASSAKALVEAGIANADLLVALTGSDETNLVCASIGRRLGAKNTIARVDDVLYRKATEISYSEHFGIDDLISPEMLTALNLASIVRNPGSLAVEHFARGTLEMQQFWTDRGAKNVGKPLHQIQLPNDVRIGSIQRDNQIIIPNGNTEILHNDLITLVGKTEVVAQARTTFEAAQPKTQKVVIMGGGHIAISLVRRLRSKTYRVTIIERNPKLCESLAESLPNATILCGDGTNLTLLQEEGIDVADFFITTTASDETNIISAIQAKNLGAKQVLVVIHRPDYAGLVEKLGIDNAVSPRVVMAREVLTWLEMQKITTLAQIDNGNAEILRLNVQSTDFVGQSLRDIALPPDCLVLALQRGKETMIPHGDTVFDLGDRIVVICRVDNRKKLAKLITG